MTGYSNLPAACTRCSGDLQYADTFREQWAWLHIIIVTSWQPCSYGVVCSVQCEADRSRNFPAKGLMTVCGARACANPGQFLAGSQQSKHRLWLLHGCSHSFCCHFTSRTGYFTAPDICIPGLRCTGGQNSINRFHRFAWKYNLIATDRSILCGSNHAARRVKQHCISATNHTIMILSLGSQIHGTRLNQMAGRFGTSFIIE